MQVKHLMMATALVLTMSIPAFAQDAATDTQRDVNQQDRIESGLKDGQLSTQEAAKLENGEKRIDDTEAKDMKNGTLTPAEQAKIQQEQNHESALIKKDDTNAVTGNPAGKSDERMQADVQRDANQETRINEGVKNGTVTNKEASHLEGREAKVDKAEAKAGANGHVGKGEQRKIQNKENKDSKRIHRQKHDAQDRKGATTTP